MASSFAAEFSTSQHKRHPKGAFCVGWDSRARTYKAGVKVPCVTVTPYPNGPSVYHNPRAMSIPYRLVSFPHFWHILSLTAILRHSLLTDPVGVRRELFQLGRFFKILPCQALFKRFLLFYIHNILYLCYNNSKNHFSTAFCTFIPCLPL